MAPEKDLVVEAKRCLHRILGNLGPSHADDRYRWAETVAVLLDDMRSALGTVQDVLADYRGDAPAVQQALNLCAGLVGNHALPGEVTAGGDLAAVDAARPWRDSAKTVEDCFDHLADQLRAVSAELSYAQRQLQQEIHAVRRSLAAFRANQTRRRPEGGE